MNRPIRIGLIAEGETELGSSVPYIKPENGGKVIEQKNEGALHTLIRRELESAGIPECNFVQRHPSSRESKSSKRRTGHSVLDPKYLAQVVISWKPEEVDIILVAVDADDNPSQRQRDIEYALQAIRNNHLDVNQQSISDRSVGGLAIRNFETWLLSDTQTISNILKIELEQLEDLENLIDTKERLEKAITESTYLSEESSNQRPLQIRWSLASQIDLAMIKTRCPNGYAAFAQDLVAAAKIVINASVKP